MDIHRWQHNLDPCSQFPALPALGILKGALTFIGQKKEQTIFLDGTAETAAKRIPQKMSRFVWLSGGQFRVLVEIIVGNGVGRAVVLVCRAVKIIRSAFRLQLNLRSGG